MTPLLILTHGQFGSVLLDAAEGMYGHQEAVFALALGADETRETFAERLAQIRLQLPSPPLVLVDLAGGTPWNVALISGCASDGGEVLAGLSLPILLEALGMRSGGLGPRELAASLAAMAPGTFLRASELIARDGGRA